MRIVLLTLLCIFWGDVLLASNAKTVEGVEYPTFHRFINDKENARLDVNCEEIKNGNGDILCMFAQTMVMHVDIDSQKEILADFKNNNTQAIEKHMTELKNMCVNFQENLKSIPYSEKAKTPEGKRILTRFTNLCADFSKNAAINYLESMIKDDSETCTIFSHSFVEKFHYNFSANQWIHQDETSMAGGVDEACGITVFSYLTKDPRKGFSDFSWNYQSRKIIGNKAGEYLGASCSKLSSDENEKTYYGIGSLNYVPEKLMNCNFISLSSF